MATQGDIVTMEPNVQAIMVAELSLGEIRDHLPPNRVHTELKKGKQPTNTAVFIGWLISTGSYKVVDGTPQLKVMLREVNPTEEMGSALEVMFHEDLALGVDEHLKKIQEDQWLMICGYRQESSLYVGMEGSVRIFYVPSHTNPLPYRNIITIWECRLEMKKRMLYGVVREVVKHPQITKIGSHHTLLSLVDPTCLHPGVDQDDIILHIFINDPGKVKLRGTVERGQIIRTVAGETIDDESLNFLVMMIEEVPTIILKELNQALRDTFLSRLQ
ncbi:hypothetical protein Hamer_G027048, partial [Homarus americanus]